MRGAKYSVGMSTKCEGDAVMQMTSTAGWLKTYITNVQNQVRHADWSIPFSHVCITELTQVFLQKLYHAVLFMLQIIVPRPDGLKILQFW